jgi:signal transduction histidine kinase
VARQPSARGIRETIDSVFLHDMKNVGFRLNLLLSNVEEHYGDPEFKRSLLELLQSTIARVDAAVGKLSEHRDSLLIKVSLDLEDLLREAQREALARAMPDRGRGPGRPRLLEEFGGVPPVWGDPSYLKDALVSIVQNAVEAAGGGGNVLLRTRAETAGHRTNVVVEIADDGPGMDEDFVRRRLFRPFQTTKRQGVGLGLYTARKILRFHRGRIEVRSAPGQGTLLRLTLPAAGKTAS